MRCGGEFGDQARAGVDVRECSVGFTEEIVMFRRCLIVLADGDGGDASVVLLPARHQPFRMTETLREGVCGLDQRHARRRRARELAQDGIHHSGSVAVAGGAGELDRFAERRVRGDAVEVAKLERAETDRRSDGRCEFDVGA